MDRGDRINGGKIEDLIFEKVVRGGKLPVVEAEDLSEDRQSLKEYQDSIKEKEKESGHASSS